MNKLHRIVAADIFGRTRALEKLCGCLSGNVEILDPYGGKIMQFSSESEAYECFSRTIGLDAYSKRLADLISGVGQPVSLLGFSVGASAVWRISAEAVSRNVTGGVCFYGSRIREYADLVPGFPLQLVFPECEPAFCVDKLVERLSRTKGVRVHKSVALHGFMNADSDNFNPEVYHRYIRILRGVPPDKCLVSDGF